MSTASAAQLRQATRVERERRRVELLGQRTLQRAGQLATGHAIHAMRLGHDPTRAARAVILGDDRTAQNGMAEPLTQMMALAYLTGRQRTFLETPHPVSPATGKQLSRQSDQEDERNRKAALLAAMMLSPSDYSDLLARTRPAATKAIGDLWAAVQRKLAGTIEQIRQAGLPHVGGGMLRQTTTIHRAAADVRAAMEAVGVTARAGHALAAIASTAGVRAYEIGRMDGYNVPAIREQLWGFHYLAVLDDRTTELCRGLDGTVLPADDDFWQQWTPPNHWNCRSMAIPVWESSALREPPEELASYKRFTDFFIG